MCDGGSFVFPTHCERHPEIRLSFGPMSTCGPTQFCATCRDNHTYKALSDLGLTQEQQSKVMDLIEINYR